MLLNMEANPLLSTLFDSLDTINCTKGTTALHLAARQGNEAMAKQLLRAYVSQLCAPAALPVVAALADGRTACVQTGPSLSWPARFLLSQPAAGSPRRLPLLGGVDHCHLSASALFYPTTQLSLGLILILVWCCMRRLSAGTTGTCLTRGCLWTATTSCPAKLPRAAAATALRACCCPATPSRLCSARMTSTC